MRSKTAMGVKEAMISRCAWGKVSEGTFFRLKTHPQQEKHRQDNIGHVTMPARPRAMFVVVHAQIFLPIFKALLNRPPLSYSPFHLKIDLYDMYDYLLFPKVISKNPPGTNGV